MLFHNVNNKLCKTVPLSLLGGGGGLLEAEGGAYTEYVWEQGAQGNIWSEEEITGDG